MTERVVTRLVPEAVVELRGEIAPDLADYARQKVAGVLRHTGRPVLHVHIQVERYRDPARERPVTAQANVDLDGTPVSVHVEATKPREAVDRLVERLARDIALPVPSLPSRRLRAAGVGTPVLMLSGMATPAAKVLAYLEGRGVFLSA